MLQSKVLGCDLDGTVFCWGSAFLDWLNKELSLNIQESQITDYLWFKSVPGLSEEIFWHEFERFGRCGGYRHLKPLPGAIDGLHKLAAAGYDIWYITKRPLYTEQDTKDSLEEHNLPFHKQLYVIEGLKSPLVRALNCDIFIDDSPSILTDVMLNTAAKVYCMDSRCNRHMDNTWMTRVHSWDEFVRCELGALQHK